MKQGIIFALITAIISGFYIFASKIFVSKMDPMVYTTLKNGLVALILSLFIIRAGIKKQLKTLSRNDWKRLIVIGIVGGSIPFALFFTGLTITNAINAAVIHKTLFLWVALLAIPFLGEKLKLVQMVGYVLVLWGVLWTTGLKFSGDTGELMIFVATILWAIENVIAKVALKRIPSEVVAWGRMTFGVIFLVGLVIVQGKTAMLFSLSASEMIATLVGTAFLTGYVLTWYKALSYAPATIVSAILVLSTPITALLSTGFLRVPFSSSLFISFILTIVGTVFITRRTSLRK